MRAARRHDSSPVRPRSPRTGTQTAQDRARWSRCRATKPGPTCPRGRDRRAITAGPRRCRAGAARAGGSLDPAFRDIFPVKPSAEKRRLELLKDAYVKARYSLTWSISREDLEVLAQRIAVLRERTSAVCQAYIDSLSDEPAPA